MHAQEVTSELDSPMPRIGDLPDFGKPFELICKCIEKQKTNNTHLIYT